MLSFAVPAWLNAQEYAPVPVTISKEKVKVDGKVYYSHIVLERQTLYSISKAYNVTIDQIYEANPAVKAEGLKKNAIILIPEAVQDSRNIPERQPKQKQKKTGSDEYIIHTVKWYENLEAISEKYGVPVEAIMEVNGLTGNKLRKRQKLMIPVGGTWSVQAAADTTAVQAAAEDSPVRKQEETAIAAESGKVNAVLVMPFDAHGLKPRTGSIDFYSGTLMAVKELGDRGADIDLNVYDASGGVIPVTEERLGLSDIVIGPVSAGDLAKTLDKCPDHTFIVSPLDHRAEYLASEHANFIQVPTPSLLLYEDLAEWIREDRQSEDEKVIVIYEKGARNIETMGVMSTILEKDGIPFSTFSYSILEGRDVQEPLMQMMNQNAANRVLVMSESEAFVNDVVRNLNLLIHSEYDVVLYGPSKIRSFETIEVDNLHNTRLHTSIAYYVDYDDPAVMDFVRKYRALYNTEPTPYAFQGYDIASYFLGMVSEYGKDWTARLETNEKEMLQADFRFIKEEGKEGCVNSGIRRIVYGPDYSITLLKD